MVRRLKQNMRPPIAAAVSKRRTSSRSTPMQQFHEGELKRAARVGEPDESTGQWRPRNHLGKPFNAEALS
jgi:hypothetical protein